MYLTPHFERAAAYESELHKDISNFTVDEIITFYKMYFSPSVYTLATLNSQLQFYAQYALAHGMVTDHQNHFAEINYELLLTCVNKGLVEQRVITRDELLKKLYEITDNWDERFICLGLFEGICGDEYEELAGISEKDFVDGDIVHLCTGRDLKISHELVHMGIESCNCYDHTVYKRDGTLASRKLDPGDDKAIKKMYNAQLDTKRSRYRRIFNCLVRLSERSQMKSLNSKALRDSGRIHIIQNLMREHNMENPIECVFAYRNVIEDRFGKMYSIPRWVAKYREYF